MRQRGRSPDNESLERGPKVRSRKQTSELVKTNDLFIVEPAQQPVMKSSNREKMCL